MGYRTLELKMKTDFDGDDLRKVIRKICQIRDFKYTIERQSLDGRNPREIKWLVRVSVSSPEIIGGERNETEQLEVPFKNTNKSVLVVGTGPAGFFAAYTCLLAGLDVTLIEKGPDVYQRNQDIEDFEKTGVLNERSNYVSGEGGAALFSDGKLTSRTKSIIKEKNFIFEHFVKNGAPQEIFYLAKPHLGSNILNKVFRNLRQDYLDRGGKLIFNNRLLDIKIKDSKLISCDTEQGEIEADYFIFAIGHHSFDTYRMLISKGVQFGTKNFALGTRVEHEQEIINKAIWKSPSLPGINAAEYALIFNDKNTFPVYSFCMCPGGKVVPAPPKAGLNIVNGMSDFNRNMPFANSAIVVGIDLNKHLSKELSPMEALDWLIELERTFYDYTNSYKAPAIRISDFIQDKTSSEFGKHSYPFELVSADFKDLFPSNIYNSLDLAFKNFVRRVHGFESGLMMGLESRTSSPIRVERDGLLCAGFDNFYFAGEGSGLAGGIVSSAADGIKCAMDIIERLP